jgi:hypothetical protein
MTDHKFKIGQKVTLSADQFDPVRTKRYEVVRLLPAERWINHYRLRSTWDGHERVAMETELI